MEFWLVRRLEGCSIPRLLSFISANRNITDKCYINERLTSPIEIINNKKLIGKTNRYTKKYFKAHKLNMTLLIFNKI